MNNRIFTTSAQRSIIIIRLMVGAIFLAEGVQKFLFPAMRGAGRFEKMGFPNPEFFAMFVGVFEVLSGVLILIGLVARGAAIAMLLNMTVAIVVTKIPVAFGESFGPFVLRNLKAYGFWSMAHEMRTDFAMWLGSLFLLIKGAGRWSIDRYLTIKNERIHQPIAEMKIIIITVVSFLASLLTLFSGFGLGTVLMPVVAIFFPIVVAVALTALVHLLNNLFKLGTLWKFVNWPVSLKFGVPALLAAIPGAWLLTRLSDFPVVTRYEIFGQQAEISPVGLGVGLLLILFAFVEWFSMIKKWDISARYLPFGGVLSGFFGGVSGHQGAFRSAFLLHAGLNAQQFVATNAVIASLVDVTRLIIYGLNLTLLMEQVEVSLIAASTVAAFAGVLAGKIGLKKVTIDFVHKLVAIMLLVLGTLMAAGIL